MRRKSIRVFVSSTFRDMHAERDHLNRIVFPELEARCRDYGVQFVGVDLRWGITEDEANSAGVLDTCLNKIDECQPYFVCLLGNRFGWIPVPDTIPVEAYERAEEGGQLHEAVKDWYRFDETSEPAVYRLETHRDGKELGQDTRGFLIEFWSRQGLPHAGESITAREIHKAMADSLDADVDGLYYFREASFLNASQFPESFRPIFQDTGEEDREKLSELKERIRSDPRCRLREYEVGYRGIRIDPTLVPTNVTDSDRAALLDAVIEEEEWGDISPTLKMLAQQYGTVALTGLEEFGSCVLEDIWDTITPELEAISSQLGSESGAAGENQHPSLYKMVEYIDRSAPLDQVATYLRNVDVDTFCVVTGRPGVGKTTFMGHLEKRISGWFPDRAVVSHFVGSTGTPTSVPHVAQAIRRKVVGAHALDPFAAPEAYYSADAYHLGDILNLTGETGDTIILLDAADQIDVTGFKRSLDFLPQTLNSNTKIIVSAAPGRALDQICEGVSPGCIVTLDDFSGQQQRNLLGAQLSLRGKSLSENQIENVLNASARPDTALPLYLMVAAEELSLYGDFQTLDRRIDRLPATLEGLFDQVLERVELDHGRELTEHVYGLLAVARFGLTEGEILALLAQMKVGVSQEAWKRLHRSLEAYLRPIDETADAVQLSFFHNQLRMAVERRYLGALVDTTEDMPEPEPQIDKGKTRFGFYIDSVWSGMKRVLPAHGLHRSTHSEQAQAFSRQIIDHFMPAGSEPRSVDEISWQLAKNGQAEKLLDYIKSPQVFLRLQRQGEAEIFVYVLLQRLFAIKPKAGLDAASHLFGVYVGNGEDLVSACQMLRIAMPLVGEHFGDNSKQMKSMFAKFAWAREHMGDTLGAQMWRDRLEKGWSGLSDIDEKLSR